MIPDEILRQREQVNAAYVAYRFACHYTKEMFAERLQPDGKARHQAALAIQHSRLREYRHQMQMLQDMERRHWRDSRGIA